MSQEYIDFGAFPDDPSADAIRTAFQKTQNNFNELFLQQSTSGVASLNQTAGLGVTVNQPTGNVILTANIACVQVSTSTLSLGRDSNGGTGATITQSSQTLVIDLPSSLNTQNIVASGNLTVLGTANFAGNIIITGGIDLSGNIIVNNLTANTVVSTTIAGALTTNSQPNITSVGNLNNLTVIGNTVLGNFVGTFANGNSNIRIPTLNGPVVVSAEGNANILYVTGNSVNVNGNLNASNSNLGNTATANYFVGTIATANQPNITSLGTLTGLTVNGNSNLGNIATANLFTGTLTSSNQPNITGVGSLTNLVVTGNITGGNANLGNSVVANFFVGDGAYLSNVIVSANSQIVSGTSNVRIYNPNTNVTISVSNTANVVVVSNTDANFTTNINSAGNLLANNIISNYSINANSITASSFIGTINTSSQPNITSLGTLTVLNVFGISNLGPVGNVIITGGSNGFYLRTNGLGGLSWSGLYSPPGGSNGDIQINDQGNLGAATGLTWNLTSNTLTAFNGTIQSNNIIGNFVTGTLVTNAQPNITSVGTLTSLIVNGNINSKNVFGGNVVSANYITGTLTTAAQPNITSVGTLANLSVTGNTSTGNLSIQGATVVIGNISSDNANLGNLVTANFVTGTLTTSSQPNITTVGTLSNLNVASTITAANFTANTGIFTGNGSGLSAIVGANVTGTVANATQASSAATAGTVTTNDQPNITNVGTLTSLGVSGSITAANITANTGIFTGNGSGLSAIAGANVTGTVSISTTATTATTAGTVTTAAQPNITSVGTLTGLTVSTTITGSVSGSAATAGTVTIAAQPNITSVGTLTSLSTAGNASAGNLSTPGVISATGNGTFGNVITGGIVSSTGNVSAGNLSTSGVLTVTGTGVSSIAGNLDMTGNAIINLATPINAQDAATKQYVDDVAQGLHTHDSCNAATTTTLTIISSGTVTYNNGTSGVGANLVTTGSFNLIDGVNVQTLGTRILVKDEVNTAHNGIYTWSNATVITRATDFDTPTEMAGGDFTFVNSGAEYDNSGWVMPDAVPIVGTSPVTWTQFSGAGTYQAGTGLTLTGSVFSVNAAQSQITSVGTLTSLSVTGNIAGGNVTTNGQVSATGNVSGLYFIGNGSQLTGIDATAIQNGSSNVRVFLNANVAISAAGNANIFTVTGTGVNVSGTLNTTGDAIVGNVTASRLISNVATGTAPLAVSSTTRVSNLNVSYANVADFINVTAPGTGTAYIIGANATTGNVEEYTSSGISMNLANNAITATTFIGTLSGGAVSSTTAGTVTTAAQPNITSVGTLTALTVSGNANVGNLGTAGVIVSSIATGTAPLSVVSTTKVANLNADQVDGYYTSITAIANTIAVRDINANLFANTVTAVNFTANTGVFTGNGNGLSALNASNISSGTLAQSRLANASVTFNGQTVALGGSGTITSNTIQALTIGTGLGGTSFNGGTAVTITNNGVLSLANGGGITASASTGAITLGSTATNANTANAIVSRDASGNFSAGTITANLAGAATSAGTITTAAQPNITSVGTLANLIVTGNANVGNLNSSGKVIGSDNFVINSNGSDSGHLVLAWPGITGLTGQANSTWNIDVDSSNNYRLFYQNTSGASGITMLGYSGNNSVLFNNNVSVTNSVSASTLTSSVATGTAPLTVTSTTRVANLNVSYANVADFVNITTGSAGNAYLLFGNALTGNIAGTANSVFVANLSTGALHATTFVGAVSGAATSATTAGTVTTAAQPNITSVGTLTSLGVNGTITAANITANTGVFTGNGSGLTSITGANVTGTVANATFAVSAGSATTATSATTAGTVTTAAQPNITSVGTLTSLAVTGNASAGNLSTAGVLTVTGTGVSSIAGNLDMTSNTIINLATPTNSNDAATKQYVDDVAQGLHTHNSCNAATTTTLATLSGGTVTYLNGVSGVGANLTTTGTFTTIDGVTLTNGMRILVKDQANAAHNGIYVRTNTTVLTRATDFDTPTEMAGGDFTFVNGGTEYDNTGWVMTDPVTTVGTSAVVWVQFSGAGTYQAGTGLTLTGSVFSVNASQSQITSVGTLTSLNSSGTITAPAFTANTGIFTGNGSGLSAIAGANVTGTVASATSAGSATTATSATTAGAVTTAAQPNITSTGTLTSLAVTGNISAGNVSATTFTGALTGAATTAGTVTTAAQGNITSVGTLTGLGVNGTITGVNITANTGVFTGNGSGLSALNASNISTGTLAQARLANSSLTVNGTAISLGGSGTVTATATNALTIGSGLGGSSYNGSSAVTITNTGVTSVVAGTNIAVSGATGAVTVNVTGTVASATTASNANLLNSISAVNLFNNMGQVHSAYTGFNAQSTALTRDFGWRFVTGTTNGPGTGTQYYSEIVGLGSEYAYNTYAMQIAYPRNTTSPYISIRYEESGSLGAWQKISAGYADTAGSATTAGTANTTQALTIGSGLSGSSFNGGTAVTITNTGVTSIVAGTNIAVSGATGAVTVNVTGTVAIANGGTGATTAATALTNLGAYPASNPSGYTTNTGTVTGVTATAPVASSGGTAPVISMAAASSGVNGYMTGVYATKLDGIAAGATNVTNTNQLTNGAGFITSAGNATNLIGSAGIIQSTITGTSYSTAYQVREASGGTSNTNSIYMPRLSFHWGGVVASSIGVETSGRIAIFNNPGTGYEAFVCAALTATTGSFSGALSASNLSGTNTGDNPGVTSVSGTAPVVSSGGNTPAISMAAASSGVNGYMTGAYATKLDGIAAGATNVTNTNQLTNGAGFITSAGTATNVSGTVAIANGGTGATTAAGALTNLGAYPASNPSGYTTNTGTVTGVTGTAPIVSSGGTAPAISISAATTGAAGSMSSTDKSKLDGIAAGATNVTNTNQLTNGAGFITSSGSAASATTAGTVTTAAQGNITSVGTLTSLAVTGNTTSGNFVGTLNGSGANVSSISATNISSGTLTQARLANAAVTLGSTALTLGTTTTTVAGLTSVTSTTFVGALTGAATTAGTVTTAAQTNITSVGTLTSLAVTGNTTSGNFVGTLNGSGANVTSISATNISSGTLAQARLANAAVTLGSTALTLGATVTTVAGLTSVTSTTFVGALTGAATTAGTVTTAAQGNITSVGTLTSLSTGNVTNSGFFIRSVATGIVAAGSTQGSATGLSKEINVVSNVNAGTGVILPTAVAGMIITIINTTGNTVSVFPASSASINNSSVNVAFSHDGGATLQYVAATTTTWRTIGATYA